MVPTTFRIALKVLLENLLRTEDGANITAEQITELGHWDGRRPAVQGDPVHLRPRVIMQDFTGVPCIVDLATHARGCCRPRW